MMQRRVAEWAQRYAGLSSDELCALAVQRLETEPRCAVTRYVLACACFDRGRSATAVRHLMIAHHADPHLQSAALLTFAGLNWVSRRGDQLLPVVLETWEEFRRPEFDRCPRERVLLNAFAASDPGLAQLPALAQRLWRLPIRTLRAQIRQAILTRDSGLYPLLSAPT